MMVHAWMKGDNSPVSVWKDTVVINVKLTLMNVLSILVRMEASVWIEWLASNAHVLKVLVDQHALKTLMIATAVLVSMERHVWTKSMDTCVNVTLGILDPTVRPT